MVKLQNKNILTFCAVGTILVLLLIGCTSNRGILNNTKDPNMIINPNEAAKEYYLVLLKKAKKLYSNKTINRKTRIEGIQSAFKLETISKSGNRYSNNEFVLTLKPNKEEINYWESWFELNKNYIEWDYLNGEIKVNYIYKDSILYTEIR